MLTPARVVGVLVLLKAVDVATYGPVLVALALGAAALLLVGRGDRVAWGLVALAALALLVAEPVERTWQHTVLLVGVAVAGAAAREPDERLVLWRVQLSVLYGFAAAAKLNATFLGGDVLAVSLRDGPLPVVLPLPVLLGAGAAVVAVEVLLAVAPWVPRLRTPALVLAGLLHTGGLVALSVNGPVGLRLLFFGGLAVALCALSAERLADR